MAFWWNFEEKDRRNFENCVEDKKNLWQSERENFWTTKFLFFGLKLPHIGGLSNRRGLDKIIYLLGCSSILLVCTQGGSFMMQKNSTQGREKKEMREKKRAVIFPLE